MKNLLLAALIMFVSSSMLWAQDHPSKYEWPEVMLYSTDQQNEQEDEGNYTREDMRKWGLMQPIRFFSIDRFSHKYP